MSNVSNFNLSAFRERINKAKTDVSSEKVVRFMVANSAEDCPIDLVIILAQCIHDFRANEMLDEAERN
jgi:hypothetical protein